MRHHVIYIPGLGDHRSFAQNTFIKIWKVFGLTPHYCPVYWRTDEPFNNKLSKILVKINVFKEQGDLVSLVGVSAGAGMAINIYAKNPEAYTSVVLICGKINNPQTVWEITYQKNPSFKESMALVANSLAQLEKQDRSKILSTHPWRDTVVPPNDTKIKGALNITFPGWGHLSGIAFALIFGTSKITRFIRSKAKV